MLRRYRFTLLYLASVGLALLVLFASRGVT